MKASSMGKIIYYNGLTEFGHKSVHVPSIKRCFLSNISMQARHNTSSTTEAKCSLFIDVKMSLIYSTEP